MSFGVVLTILILMGCRSSQPNPVFIGPGASVAPSLPSDLSPKVSEPALLTEERGEIEEYVELGLERNPKIQELKSRIESIRFQIPQVLALPDPVLNSTTHIRPVQTAAGEQRFGLGVSQKLVNRDRRATRALIVQEKLNEAEANLTQLENEIAEDIRKSCWKLLAIRKSIEISAEDKKALVALVKLVEKQFEVDKKISQQDVLNVQVEVSILENQIASLKNRERKIESRLARLVHVDPGSALTITDGLKIKFSIPDLEALTLKALSNRPELRAQLAIIQKHYTETHLAHLQSKPDLTVGLNWIGTSSTGISPVANGADALLLGVGMNLPVNQTRIFSSIGEKESTKQSSESRLESLKAQISEEIFDTLSELETNVQNLNLIQEDILPKSQRSLKLSQEDYSAGRIDYEQLISNWRKVLKFQIAESDLQSNVHQLVAQLTRQVGQRELLALSLENPLDTSETGKE